MSDDLVSLRLLVVSADTQGRDLFRQGVGLATVPIDLVEADHAAQADACLHQGEFDLVLLDTALPQADKALLIQSARSRAKPPFIILVAGAAGTITEDADALVAKPRDVAEAQSLAQRCVRVRVPSRVLVVDDSPTMRKIVGKTLTASRFPVEILEAGEGTAALELARRGGIDMVFLDYNMPGLDGLETLRELKRAQPDLEVVIISSTEDKAVAARAREAGAAAFLRKPFYPADIDAVLRAFYGLAPLKGTKSE